MLILFCRKMTRKKKNELSKSPQNSSEWQALLERESLLLLDIYPGWAGPTASINFFINKFNVELQVQNYSFTSCKRITGKQVKTGREVKFLSVNCYAVPELEMFKGQCHPVFVMISQGEKIDLQQSPNCLPGRPVSVVHGSRTERLKVSFEFG